MKVRTLTPASQPFIGVQWVQGADDQTLQRRPAAGESVRDGEFDGHLRPNPIRRLLHHHVRLGRPDPAGKLLHHRFSSLDTRVSALDAKIDDLYRLPLAEFTGARNALAKSLTGDEAKRVRKLEKPTVVPWAANQVYWRARSTYDRLMKSGEKLRAAQIAALEGRAADVRSASEAHRRAIADAVAEAERLSSGAGAKPSPDALARTFESLSLATRAPETPGRLTDALQPAGFEALAGITDIKVRSEKSEGRSTRPELVKSDPERRTPSAEPTNDRRGEGGRTGGGEGSRPRRRGTEETRSRGEGGRSRPGPRRRCGTPGARNLGARPRRLARGTAGADRTPPEPVQRRRRLNSGVPPHAKVTACTRPCWRFTRGFAGLRSSRPSARRWPPCAARSPAPIRWPIAGAWSR